MSLEPHLPGLARTTTSYPTLREANVARQLEWDPDNVVDLSWRCNELAGEAGEVCNILKKLHRERVGLKGSRAVKEDLAEELADVIICCDLVSMTAEIDPPGEGRFNGAEFASLTDAGNALSARVGSVSALVFEPEKGSLLAKLRAVTMTVASIARAEGIDMPTAVAMKFNSTSHKVGLSTRLRYTDD